MPRGRPVEPETRARILELARGGMGRNAIAREVGVSGAAVTSICEPEGIAFDWSTTEVAVAARRIQIDDMRTDLARAALLRAGEMLEAFSSPTARVDFSPATDRRAASYHEYVSDGPTISDLRNLATTFGILTQRASDLLAKPMGTAGKSEAASVIEGLGTALITVAAGMAGDDDDPTKEPPLTSREDMIAELQAQAAEEGVTVDADEVGENGGAGTGT